MEFALRRAQGERFIKAIHGEPFGSPFGLSLAKTERLAQDKLVEGRIQFC